MRLNQVLNKENKERGKAMAEVTSILEFASAVSQICRAGMQTCMARSEQGEKSGS